MGTTDMGLEGTAPASPAQAAAAGPKICSNCGADIPAGFKFCGICGAPVEQASAEATSEAPAPAQQEAPVVARLIFIRPDGSEGGEFPLRSGVTKIGRDHGDIFAADGYLSPNHAEVVVEGGEFLLRDTGSLNGVFFRITAPEVLQSGDVFRIGQELLRFDAIAPPEPLEDGTEIMGSPNPGYWGRLTRIVGYGVDGEAHLLKGDRVVAGREHGDILFPEDGYVSGTHLEVVRENGQVLLRDLGSSNGTFLKLRTERLVSPGTFVLMGQQLFRLEMA